MVNTTLGVGLVAQMDAASRRVIENARKQFERLGIEARKLNDTTKRTTAGAVPRVGTEAEKARKRIQALRRDFTAMIRQMRAGFAAASGVVRQLTTSIAFLTVGFVALTKRTADYGDAMVKAARNTGIAAENFQSLGFAFELAAIEQRVFVNALAGMNRAISNAQTGLENYTRPFEILRLRISELQALSPENQFRRISDALIDLEHAGLRAATAQLIFGRAGRQILSVTDDLREFESTLFSVGGVAGERSLVAMEQFNDTLAITGRIFKTQLIEAFAAFTGALGRTGETFLLTNDQMRSFAVAVREVIERAFVAIRVMGQFLKIMVQIFAVFKAAQATLVFTQLFTTGATAFRRFYGRAQQAAKAMTALSAATAGANVAAGAGAVAFTRFGAAFRILQVTALPIAVFTALAGVITYVINQISEATAEAEELADGMRELGRVSEETYARLGSFAELSLSLPDETDFLRELNEAGANLYSLPAAARGDIIQLEEKLLSISEIRTKNEEELVRLTERRAFIQREIEAGESLFGPDFGGGEQLQAQLREVNQQISLVVDLEFEAEVRQIDVRNQLKDRIEQAVDEFVQPLSQIPEDIDRALQDLISSRDRFNASIESGQSAIDLGGLRILYGGFTEVAIAGENLSGVMDTLNTAIGAGVTTFDASAAATYTLDRATQTILTNRQILVDIQEQEATILARLQTEEGNTAAFREEATSQLADLGILAAQASSQIADASAVLEVAVERSLTETVIAGGQASVDAVVEQFDGLRERLASIDPLGQFSADLAIELQATQIAIGTAFTDLVNEFQSGALSVEEFRMQVAALLQAVDGTADGLGEQVDRVQTRVADAGGDDDSTSEFAENFTQRLSSNLQRAISTGNFSAIGDAFLQALQASLVSSLLEDLADFLKPILSNAFKSIFSGLSGGGGGGGLGAIIGGLFGGGTVSIEVDSWGGTALAVAGGNTFEPRFNPRFSSDAVMEAANFGGGTVSIDTHTGAVTASAVIGGNRFTPRFNPRFSSDAVMEAPNFGGIFHDGGIVPGQTGTDVPILAQAGELVLTRGQQADLSSALELAGVNVTINATGDVTDATRRALLSSGAEVGRIAYQQLREQRILV